MIYFNSFPPTLEPTFAATTTGESELATLTPRDDAASRPPVQGKAPIKRKTQAQEREETRKHRLTALPLYNELKAWVYESEPARTFADLDNLSKKEVDPDNAIGIALNFCPATLQTISCQDPSLEAAQREVDRIEQEGQDIDNEEEEELEAAIAEEDGDQNAEATSGVFIAKGLPICTIDNILLVRYCG